MASERSWNLFTFVLLSLISVQLTKRTDRCHVMPNGDLLPENLEKDAITIAIQQSLSKDDVLETAFDVNENCTTDIYIHGKNIDLLPFFNRFINLTCRQSIPERPEDDTSLIKVDIIPRDHRWSEDYPFLESWITDDNPLFLLRSITLAGPSSTFFCNISILRNNYTMQAEVIIKGCPENRYGPRCKQDCLCGESGFCHTLYGQCICKPGFYGVNCSLWKPTAILTPSDPSVEQGARIELHCTAYVRRGVSITNITWHHNGEELWSEAPDNRTFLISESKLDNSGVYQCTAIDDQGNVYITNTSVTVTEQEATDAPKQNNVSRNDTTIVDLPSTHTTDSNVAAVIGPVLGVAIAMAAVLVIGVWVWRRKNRNPSRQNGLILAESSKDAFVRIFLKGYEVSGNERISELQRKISSWHVAADLLDLGETLGSGEFSVVHQGTLRRANYVENIVAIKIMQMENDISCRRDLTAEFKMLSELWPHKNIINMFGVSMVSLDGVDRRCLVVEYMDQGNLLDYLRRKRNNLEEIRGDILVKFVSDIIIGMEHLSSKQILHRDLAARNILLKSGTVAKIGDFGMSRDPCESGFYKVNLHAGKRLPWLWMALETHVDGTYTTQSDVWSFGVLLWEIITLGQMPYPGVSPPELMEFLRSGKRMNKPKKPLNCPEVWYKVMTSCWQEIPDERPSFTSLREEFATPNTKNTPSVLDLSGGDSAAAGGISQVELQGEYSTPQEITDKGYLTSKSLKDNEGRQWGADYIPTVGQSVNLQTSNTYLTPRKEDPSLRTDYINPCNKPGNKSREADRDGQDYIHPRTNAVHNDDAQGHPHTSVNSQDSTGSDIQDYVNPKRNVSLVDARGHPYTDVNSHEYTGSGIYDSSQSQTKAYRDDQSHPSTDINSHDSTSSDTEDIHPRANFLDDDDKCHPHTSVKSHDNKDDIQDYIHPRANTVNGDAEGHPHTDVNSDDSTDSDIQDLMSSMANAETPTCMEMYMI